MNTSCVRLLLLLLLRSRLRIKALQESWQASSTRSLVARSGKRLKFKSNCRDESLRYGTPQRSVVAALRRRRVCRASKGGGGGGAHWSKGNCARRASERERMRQTRTWTLCVCMCIVARENDNNNNNNNEVVARRKSRRRQD